MLNKEQKQFVEYPEEHLMVIGSAGSGKTHSLVERIRYLVEERHIDPSRILVSSFTNTGVKELQGRITDKLGLDGEFIEMSTLHSWGYRIIKNYYRENSVGGEKYIDGRILFDIALYKHYDQIFKQLPSDLQEDYNPKLFMNKIASLKKLGITPDMYKAQLNGGIQNSFMTEAEELEAGLTYDDSFDSHVLQFYQMSEQKHKDDATCDANDLIMEAYNILNKSSKYRQQVKNRYDHILIDEAQDTSKLVHDILHLLKDEVCITLIGDAKQAIYGFSMAVAKLFLSFENEFNAGVVSLKRNYRSNPAIVDKANMVSNRMSFTSAERDEMISERDGESEITIDTHNDLFEEAESIAEKLKERHEAGEDISDTFILHRTNSQVLMVEQSLFNRNIPYINLSKSTILDNKIIKGIVGWLRVLEDKSDNKAMEMCFNYPNRFLGFDFLKRAKGAKAKNLLEAISAHNFFTKPYEYRACQDIEVTYNKLYRMYRKKEINAIIDYLYEEGIKKERMKVNIDGEEMMVTDSPDSLDEENIAMLKQTIDVNGLENFIEFTKNVRKKEGKGVILRTVHSSKGLEADHIIIAGMNDSKFPHRAMMDMRETPKGYEHLFGHPIEEELNLFYVAVTRAKKTISINIPLMDEKGQFCIPSVFIKEGWDYE